MRDMATGKVTPLAGTEGGHTPFFSPDAASLAFFADGKLKKLAIESGATQALADAPYPWGGFWGTDGAIYFNRCEGEGILRVAAEGGPVQVVTKAAHLMPELLGRGPGLLVTGASGTAYVRENASPKFVVAGSGARYAPSGHLVYAAQGQLWGVPFDRSRIEVAGPPVSLFDDLRTAYYGVAQFTLAQDGTLVYASGRPQDMTSFVWVDRQGGTKRLRLPEGSHSAFDLSPDGTRLVFTEAQGAESVIWMYDLQRDTVSRLTARAAEGSPAQNLLPRWAPDGRHVVYRRLREQQAELVWLATEDGSETVLWSSKDPGDGPEWLYPMSFSPDGAVMAVFGPSPKKSFDIWLMRLNGIDRPVARAPELFLGERFGESFGQISPDGRWMLYSSDRSGRYEIYVTSYPKSGEIHQISRNGGREPEWNPNGGEILYLNGMQIYAVDVTPGPVFRCGEPRLLFEGPYPDIAGHGFDIAPDGQHFLMLENKDLLQPSATLNVVTNFFEDLRRRAPPGNGKR